MAPIASSTDRGHGRAGGCPLEPGPHFLDGHLFVIRFDQGRLGELEQPLRDRVAAVPGLFALRAYLALVLCELDRPEEAVEHYELLAAENFATLPREPGWMIGVSQCAAVAASLRDRAGARVLFDLLAPYASQIVFTNAGAIGAVAHYLAVLAATFSDFDEAQSRFAVAATTPSASAPRPGWPAPASSGPGCSSPERSPATPSPRPPAPGTGHRPRPGTDQHRAASSRAPLTA
jgi:hypothetical protein